MHLRQGMQKSEMSLDPPVQKEMSGEKESVTGHWTSPWWDAEGVCSGFTPPNPVFPRDDDLCEIFQATSKGCADKKLRDSATIITSFVSERFGSVVVSSKNDPYCKNRRKIQMKNLRQELKALKKQHKRASSEEKIPLVEVRDILRRKLKSI